MLIVCCYYYYYYYFQFLLVLPLGATAGQTWFPKVYPKRKLWVQWWISFYRPDSLPVAQSSLSKQDDS